MTRACALGLDFGTASCRAVIVDTTSGVERGTAVTDYPHGVMEHHLPDGTPLPGPDWALQHPGDYLEAMTASVTSALDEAGLPAEAIVGVGLDFTACTMLPVDASHRPLCLDAALAARPHAWVKLWKHHAAQTQADRLNAVATDRGEAFLADYGGRTSSEWLVAKVLQILDEDPDLYAIAAGFVEAADWVAAQLTGCLVRNTCGAGYKGLWSRARGFPSDDFFEALDPRLRHFTRDKLPGPVVPPGQRAGGLTPAWAARLGLRAGTAVATPIIDAHSAVLGAGVVSPGRLVMVLGTSTCHMLLAERAAAVEGIAGVVADGIVAGYHGYEAGQAAVGDIFGWFARIWGREAPDTGFERLEREAEASGPGAHGLIALDWWNGNRSVLANADLSGLLVGLTLQTTAGDLYRALIEATGFGTRRILQAFGTERIAIDEIVATGGLADASPLLLQVYADITGRPIHLARTANASALGAAMLGAVAAGDAGGHPSFDAAAARMAGRRPNVVKPNPALADHYDTLYGTYLELHDHFGRGGTSLMSRLRRLRDSDARRTAAPRGRS